jgi:hypothetical protein
MTQYSLVFIGEVRLVDQTWEFVKRVSEKTSIAETYEITLLTSEDPVKELKWRFKFFDPVMSAEMAE